MLCCRAVGAKNNVDVAPIIDLLEHIANARLFRSCNRASSGQLPSSIDRGRTRPRRGGQSHRATGLPLQA
jgi:hypothetical protein